MRIDGSGERKVVSLNAGSAAADSMVARAGDEIDIPRILERLEQTVELAGHVHRPGPYQWFEGMPVDPIPDESPPEGLYKALRGFGLMSREDFSIVLGANTYHEALGWATAPEIGYIGYYQCDATNTKICYFSGSNGDIYQLYAWGAAWEIREP